MSQSASQPRLGRRPPRTAPDLAAARHLLAATLRSAGHRVRPTVAVGARALTALLLEALAVAALLALPALYFWRVLTPEAGDMATFPIGDFTDLHWPYRHFVSDELARGQIPFWNPYVSAGHPSVGDIQFASLYPIGALIATWAGAGMPFAALEAQVVVHFALSGLFTYLLGRRILRTRPAAFVAALVFTYGGYLTSFPVQQMIILQVSVWLPLILLFLDLAICYRSPALAIPAGAALAMAALAGHPQTLFYVLLGAGAYFVFRCLDRGLHLTQPLSGLLFLAVGFGLAAPQLIPAYEHLKLTTRDTVEYSFTTHGFSPREMFGFLAPYRFGGQALYQGILPLALVGVALLNRAAGRARWFWLGLAIVALLFSFGGHTFLQSLLYLGLPPLKFRDHERFSFLIGLAVAFLAGIGVDGLLRRSVSRDAIRRCVRWALVALAFVAGLAGLFLYGAVTGLPEVRGTFDGLADRTLLAALFVAISAGLIAIAAREHVPALWPLLVILFIGADLFTASWQQNLRAGTPDKLLAVPAYASYLQTQTSGLFRIASEGILPGDGNAGPLYRLQDTVGNSPLEMDGYVQFNKDVNEWQRWRLLNVRYLVTKRNVDGDGRFRLAAREGDVSVYEIEPDHVLPRAWVVERVRFAGSPADARTLTDAIDPTVEAVVEDERLDIGGTGEAAGNGVSDTTRPRVAVVEYSPERIVVEAEAPRPALLVLSEVYHPDWTAKVDGSAVEIVRTNAILRGVPLDAGKHTVEFSIEPRGFLAGVEWAGKAARLAIAILVAEVVLRLALLALPPLFRRTRSLFWSRPEPVRGTRDGL